MTSGGISLLTEAARVAVESWSHEPIEFGPPIRGGNNLIVRGMTSSGKAIVVKQYLTARDDGRSRLLTEYAAIKFMRDAGIDNVPEALVCAPEQSLAVYSFISGVRLRDQDISIEHVDAEVAFLSRLAELRHSETSKLIRFASDACPTLEAYFSNFEERLKRLERIVPASKLHRQAIRLVEGKIRPTYSRIRETLLADSLPPVGLTLSPSDFGFHNALADDAGRLHFFDFEYFGWDDPAKMISDFLHHQAFTLSVKLGDHFRTQMLHVFADERQLDARLRLVYPMVGLNWTLICLKPFTSAETDSNRLEAQLERSEAKLGDVRRSLD
jgi:thiamine kinase-like enzyme